MKADQLKGKWLQFKGDLQNKWGKFTDNDLQEIGGNYDKFLGKVQERYGEKRRELMKWASHWHDKPATDAARKK
jgi:uncharacterized protein YjbJ (UPF0337 family)